MEIFRTGNGKEFENFLNLAQYMLVKKYVCMSMHVMKIYLIDCAANSSLFIHDIHKYIPHTFIYPKQLLTIYLTIPFSITTQLSSLFTSHSNYVYRPRLQSLQIQPKNAAILGKEISRKYCTD